MGDPKGFLKYNRSLPPFRDPKQRVNDFKEFVLPVSDEHSKEQAARCMDCGIPFCHHGCPLGNNIPEFNDAAYRGNWRYAVEIMETTNNFPEFTGRVCPAPCESACVLGINQPPVTIEYIEKSIGEKGFQLGYIKPHPPQNRTGKKVAVIGSGPAGLAAAAQLNYAGHWVTVYERADHVGGLLRYGIPDFKMEKWVIERRVEVMEKEGIVFKTNAEVGVNINAKNLVDGHDAVVMCGGSTVPRDLPIPGRELNGVHFAMDFLTQQNKRVNHQWVDESKAISAKGKNVVVIGGGDTGSDCVGTSNRQKAASVTQIELLPKPPEERDESMPWPTYPNILKNTTSHHEGCERKWSLFTKEFISDGNGNLKAIKVAEMGWTEPEPGKMPKYVEIEGTDFIMPCELALIAIGFLHPQRTGMLEELGIELDKKGNVSTKKYQTNNPKIFSAGDMRRGQSLVVWAISEGREAARNVDEYLMGESHLEGKDVSFFTLEDEMEAPEV